jgi:hypothetical protein
VLILALPVVALVTGVVEFLFTLFELNGQVSDLLFVLVVIFASVVERSLQVFDFILILFVVLLCVV